MRNAKKKIDVTESEITAMTSDVEQLHHDVGMPALYEGMAQWRESVADRASRPTSRRIFLLGAGSALAGAGALAAVTSTPGLAAAATRSKESSKKPGSAKPANPEAGLKGTLAVAALAASLENLAVYTYTQALAAAAAGKLGTVPPAVGTFATTVRSQHEQHADAWNALLISAHKHKVTVTDPALTPTVNAALGKVTDAVDVAELALELEIIAAETYQAEASRLKSPKAISVAATIQPVEMQHVAILYYVLGKYPGVQSSTGTPLAFSPTTKAA